MRENVIERKIRQATERMGGIAVKMGGERGMPDRLLLLPGGRMVFVETKAPTGRVQPRQVFLHSRLKRLGYQVEVIRTLEQAAAFIDEQDRYMETQKQVAGFFQYMQAQKEQELEEMLYRKALEQPVVEERRREMVRERRCVSVEEARHVMAVACGRDQSEH